MTNEEMQRAMEFIVQQQAQYAARFDKDEARMVRLEGLFATLVEFVRGTDERLDTLALTIATMGHTINELVQTMITLGDEQTQMGARLTESQIRLDTKMAELAEAQSRTNATLSQTDARLTESQIRLNTKMAELVEAQARTDVRLSSVIDLIQHNGRSVN